MILALVVQLRYCFIFPSSFLSAYDSSSSSSGNTGIGGNTECPSSSSPVASSSSSSSGITVPEFCKGPNTKIEIIEVNAMVRY